MFFYNPFKGLKDLPQKNLKQLSIVMGVGLLSIFLLLIALVLI
jgi:hypothetical protein